MVCGILYIRSVCNFCSGAVVSHEPAAKAIAVSGGGGQKFFKTGCILAVGGIEQLGLRSGRDETAFRIEGNFHGLSRPLGIQRMVCGILYIRSVCNLCSGAVVSHEPAAKVVAVSGGGGQKFFKTGCILAVGGIEQLGLRSGRDETAFRIKGHGYGIGRIECSYKYVRCHIDDNAVVPCGIGAFIPADEMVAGPVGRSRRISRTSVIDIPMVDFISQPVIVGYRVGIDFIQCSNDCVRSDIRNNAVVCISV